MVGVIIFTALFCFLFYKAFTSDHRQLNNHWSQYLIGVRFPTKDFYEKLKKELLQHDVPNLAIKEVTISEGGVFSTNRLYLRLSWKDLQYDVCFAPFGNSDSFISWWLWRTPAGLELIFSSVTTVGVFFNNVFFPQTYYRVDSSNMFMTFAQSKVLKVLDEIMKEQNITALPENERYPLKQFIKVKK